MNKISKEKNWLVTRTTLFPVQKNEKWKMISRGHPKILREVTRSNRLHLSVRPGQEAAWSGCTASKKKRRLKIPMFSGLSRVSKSVHPRNRSILPRSNGVGQPVRDFVLASAKHLSHASPQWKIENRFRKRHAHAPT